MAACHEPGLRWGVSCGRAGWLFGRFSAQMFRKAELLCAMARV